MVCTIDASVFLNAFLPHEAGHEQSAQLLARLREEAVPMVSPTLLLPEVAAAISRAQDDDSLARAFASALAQLSQLVLVPLDTALAGLATDLAARHRLRGGDAVYVAVALRFGAVLVTRDREQHDRAAPAVAARTPAEMLAEGG